MGRKILIPTEAEDAGINRGMALDPDNPELGDDWFKRAHPAREVLPPAVYNELLDGQQRTRGPGRKPAKVRVTLRVDRDALEALRASGPGSQSRAQGALRKLAGRR